MFVFSLVTLYLGFTLLASASPLPVVGPLERNLANTNVVQNSLFSDSSSPTVLSLARRFNSTGSSNVLKFDQARAKAMQQRGRTDEDPSSAADASVINVDATSQAVSYVVEVSPSRLFSSFAIKRLVRSSSAVEHVGVLLHSPIPRTDASL